MPVVPTKSSHDIRLVAIDLDGTLLDDQKRISHRAIAGLSAATAKGVKVVIASARPPRSVRHIYAALKLDTWQINYNGALIWDEPAKKSRFHGPIAASVVHKLIRQARDLYPDVLVSCELMDRWYTDRVDGKHTTETGRLFPPDVVAPLEDFWNVSMTKVLLLGNPRMMNDLETSLGMAFDDKVTLVRTDPDLIQIMDKRNSKAIAVEKVAAHYRVTPRQVMAIGDAPNDFGMLRMAGVAVAMDNAHASVKKIAHWVAPSNNDHGVHAALVRYGLCE
ncbi:MAG: Cof-type HAD-IIB family hydrolase [Tepidisphaeraceae bacterium]